MVYHFKDAFGNEEVLNSTAMNRPIEMPWTKIQQFLAVGTLSLLIINSIHDPIRAYLLVCWAIGVASGVIWLY